MSTDVCLRALEGRFRSMGLPLLINYELPSRKVRRSGCPGVTCAGLTATPGCLLNCISALTAWVPPALIPSYLSQIRQ